jgi:hypothetical protein
MRGRPPSCKECVVGHFVNHIDRERLTPYGRGTSTQRDRRGDCVGLHNYGTA